MTNSTLTSWSTEEWPEYQPDLIVPRLYQGGTEDHHVIGMTTPSNHYSNANQQFDLVVTLYADAQPAPWGVQEMRYGFPDGPLGERDAQRIIQIASDAYRHWQNGDCVLVRCQAGVNRSGLVTALILMTSGLSAVDAIALIRRQRSPFVLSNSHFENWLLAQD